MLEPKTRVSKKYQKSIKIVSKGPKKYQKSIRIVSLEYWAKEKVSKECLGRHLIHTLAPASVETDTQRKHLVQASVKADT